ncbi:unnamed protein product, partial [Didymodactylos carnosus]
ISVDVDNKGLEYDVAGEIDLFKDEDDAGACRGESKKIEIPA